MGATFVVERSNGERIGSYKTDVAGKIIMPDLSEGTYIVSETIASDGYTRDKAPKTVVVKTGKLTVVEFRNKPLSGIELNFRTTDNRSKPSRIKSLHAYKNQF